MIILWIAIGIIALGVLFVLSLAAMARISDKRYERMIRQMHEESEESVSLRGTKCGHM
jgi:hypothetical protein